MVWKPLLVLRCEASGPVDDVPHLLFVESHCVSHLGHLLIATIVIQAYHVLLHPISRIFWWWLSFINNLVDNFGMVIGCLGDVLV